MWGRRDFVKGVLAGSIGLAGGSVLAMQGQTSAATMNKHSPITMGSLKPKRLKKGQTVGLIAPSSNVKENEDIHYAREVLASFGFTVKLGKNLFERRGYLAGIDKLRANDVNDMFTDTSVDAIVCLRGGYGSPRILPYLDYQKIKANPKVICGYSDVTALLNAITAKTGMVTFHGPIANQRFSNYTLASFKDVLFSPKVGTLLGAPPPFEVKEGWVERENRLTIIREGKATGRLIGGNLSLMVSLVGSVYEPDYRGNILFLEDIQEAPYRIDRMLTHLKLAGRLQQLAGIAFGKCTKCSSRGNTLSLEQVVYDHLEPLGIPVIRGLMIGHIADMATIPVGAIAELDTSAGAIKLLEKAVT